MEKLQKEVTPRPINSLGEFITRPPASQSKGITINGKLTACDYTQTADGCWMLKKPLKTEPISLSFDDEDVAILATNLTLDQVKNGIKKAEIEQGAARMWAKDADVAYWREFGKICRRTLEVQRSRQPQVEVRGGKLSVRAVKETHNIVDIINRYTNLRKAGKEYMGKCPFHDDRQPSLEVNEEKQLFYCFSCQRKGDLINFIMQIENLDTKQACLFLST